MYKFLKQFSAEQKVVSVIAGLIFILHFLPYFLQGEAAYIRIHDTLEGEWIWLTTLVNEGLALSYDMDAAIAPIMNGIPRFMFPSGWSFNVLFIYLFGSFWGYVASYLLVRLIAFAGAYFLLKEYILPSKDELVYRVLLALIFSLIPFFTALGLTVAGQPLIILAFLHLLHRSTNVWEYFVILLFPFYTSIVWCAPFIGLLLIALAIHHFIKEKEVPKKFLLFFVLMNILYLLANYHMVYAMFVSEIPIHRIEYNPFKEWTASLSASLTETLYIFFLGHYHVGMWLTVPIFILSIFTFHKATIRRLLAMILMIALINGFYIYLVPALNAVHPILISFVIKRMSVLLPTLWLLVLALVVLHFIRAPAGRRLVLFYLGSMVIIGFFANDELQHNYRNLLGFQKKPGFRAFVSEDLFRNIQQRIGKDQSTYRVASLGLNPSIAQYNGFYTADGLQSIYPLRQKHAFKKILSDEFKKDDALSNYFIAWGNRCYLFSSELGFSDAAFMISRKQDKKINHWDVDASAMKDLDIQYLFSAVRIENYEELGMVFLDTFEQEDAWWRIHLYKLE